jgi:hypothetical protein
MEQPPRFVAPRFAQGKSGKVCRLRKAIYGLKESLRAWFDKFSEAIVRFELHRCQSNNPLFFSTSQRGKMLLIVYLDNINIIGDDKKGIEELKEFLQSLSQSKDLGKLQ